MDSCLLLEVSGINMEKKLVDTAKRSATDAIKPVSKRAIQKIYITRRKTTNYWWIEANLEQEIGLK